MTIFMNGAPGVYAHSLQGLLPWQVRVSEMGERQMLSVEQADTLQVLSAYDFLPAPP